MALMAPRLRGVWAIALLVSPGCAVQPPDAAIRDVRPLQMERGDKVIVEAAADSFAVGAETTVSFGGLLIDGAPLMLPARAVAPRRVLFDVDRTLEDRVRKSGGHIVAKTPVTVHQTVGGQKRKFSSAPDWPFEVDLFPPSLHSLSNHLADLVGGDDRALWGWLGFVATPTTGGLAVKALVARFDKDEFFRKHDSPPMDGKVTDGEAKRSGLSPELFAWLDGDRSGSVDYFEVEHQPEENGIAAAAGLQVGDLITSANGKAVATVSDLAAAWKVDGVNVALGVQRAGGKSEVQLPRYGRPMAIPSWLFFALCMALAAGLVALPVPVIGGLIVVWERKISAYMQSRIGPNRVGPNGWLQWLADGLKLILKEDLIPKEADPILFRASPYLAFVGLFLVFMVLPFTQWIIVADLNIGLLFLLSVTSLVVVSIIMGGWSSNSKWSLLGGMRSAAQIISYELPASVALLTIATLTGSLSTEAIVRAQGGVPWEWHLFRNPFTFVAFFIYFISALAEGNRTPFDLPEAESELVSGYNTEYSGFRFSLFPLVEWVNLFVIGAVAAMLFCGGWRVPGLSIAVQDQHWYWQLLGFGVYLAKIIGFIFVIIWIRWTLPRFRVDQMMNLCWKFFIPISFVCFIGVLALVWLLPPWLYDVVGGATFVVGGMLPLAIFLKKVQYNRSRYRELNLNPLL